jgi:hypothetical protein
VTFARNLWAVRRSEHKFCMVRWSPAVGEPDVQASQVGLQPGILHGNEVRGCARLVEVGVPHARRGDERTACLPVHAGRVDDVALLV